MPRSTDYDLANAVQRARDIASKRGWRVSKLRGRKLRLTDEHNNVLLGENYDASPQQVIDFCKEQGASRRS